MRAPALILIGMISCRSNPTIAPTSSPSILPASSAATLSASSRVGEGRRVSLRYLRAADVALRMNLLAAELAQFDHAFDRTGCVLYWPGFETRSFDPKWRIAADIADNSVIVHAGPGVVEHVAEIIVRLDSPRSLD